MAYYAQILIKLPSPQSDEEAVKLAKQFLEDVNFMSNDVEPVRVNTVTKRSGLECVDVYDWEVSE